MRITLFLRYQRQQLTHTHTTYVNTQPTSQAFLCMLYLLTSHILHPQVSVDVAWGPFDVDGRNYDYAAIADAADILFVMAYDTRSQIYGPCLASANTPLA
jgi:spore germination protein YaaH